MWLNHRFANAVVSGGQQYEDHFNVADSFPFSYAETTDHFSGRTDAILKRPETDPLVIHTQTSTEYWQRRGALVHTDTRGNDLPQPPTVRIYFWASSQHFADPNPLPLERGIRQNFLNTVATSMLFRAMIDAMDRWATDGISPPDSRIPRRADGTLVTFEEWRRYPAAREPGRTAHDRRSAALDPGALPRRRGICRGDHPSRAPARGGRFDARRRCGTSGCSGGELGPAAP